jgi:hypothetical protein
VGRLFFKTISKTVNKVNENKLTDTEATILDGCALKEYLTIFSETPSKKAKTVNNILRETNLRDLKGLILKRIKLAAEIIKTYSGAKKAKIISLDYEIEQKASGLSATTFEDFNNYIVSIFRASEQKIDKSISMLDFYNLESQVEREYKMRQLNEAKRK